VGVLRLTMAAPASAKLARFMVLPMVLGGVLVSSAPQPRRALSIFDGNEHRNISGFEYWRVYPNTEARGSPGAPTLPSRSVGSFKHTDGKTYQIPVVINLGLPKSGSTSIKSFMDNIYKHTAVPFQSCHWKVSAWKGHAKLIQKYGKGSDSSGWVCDLMKHTENFGFKDNGQGFNYGNMPLGKSGEKGCATIAQADCETPPTHGYFPQMSLAEKMMRDIPEAYFVLVTRHTEGWAKSVAGWSNMWQRFKKMKLPNKPKGWPRDERDMVQWQQTHYNITRNLAEKHGVRFFELALEHSGTEIVDFVDWLQLPPSFSQFWTKANSKHANEHRDKNGQTHAEKLLWPPGSIKHNHTKATGGA